MRQIQKCAHALVHSQRILVFRYTLALQRLQKCLPPMGYAFFCATSIFKNHIGKKNIVLRDSVSNFTCILMD